MLQPEFVLEESRSVVVRDSQEESDLSWSDGTGYLPGKTTPSPAKPKGLLQHTKVAANVIKTGKGPPQAGSQAWQQHPCGPGFRGIKDEKGGVVRSSSWVSEPPIPGSMWRGVPVWRPWEDRRWLPAFSLRCGALSPWPLWTLSPWRAVSSNKHIFLWVALVMMTYHSNEKVTNSSCEKPEWETNEEVAQYLPLTYTRM